MKLKLLKLLIFDWFRMCFTVLQYVYFQQLGDINIKLGNLPDGWYLYILYAYIPEFHVICQSALFQSLRMFRISMAASNGLRKFLI